MIKIQCNRCGKEIDPKQKVGFIQICSVSPFDFAEREHNESISERAHYCDDCVAEIWNFMQSKAEVSKTETVEIKIEEPTETVPLLREKDFKSEPHSKRRRIDYERIMSLKESGMANKDIAKEMCMTSQEIAVAVYTYKKRQEQAGEEKQEEPQKQEKEPEKKIDVGKIMALHNAKWSIAKIAEEMNLSSTEIYDVIYQKQG